MKLDEFEKKIDELKAFEHRLRDVQVRFRLEVLGDMYEITEKIIDEFEQAYSQLEEVSTDLNKYWEDLWAFHGPLKQALAEKEDCQYCGSPLYYYEGEEQFRYDHMRCRGEAA